MNQKFAKLFVREYKEFVFKKNGQLTVQQLSVKIEEKTKKLRKLFKDQFADIRLSD